MKRVILLTGWALWAGVVQVGGQGISSYGVKAGLSLSNQSYRLTPLDYTLETDPITAPSFAIFLEAFRGDHFSFQSDIAYACRGSSTTTRSVTVDHLREDRLIVNQGERTTSRFRYLSLSPMARFRAGKGRITPYALAGVRLDLLLQYRTDSEYPLEEQNSVILGLDLGGGVEFGAGRTGLLLEVRYQPDLSPVTDREPLLINNNSLLFSLGIRWNSSP